MKCRDSEIPPTGELDVPTQHRIMVNETNKWTFAKVPRFPPDNGARGLRI